jgi:hypothetical protein
MAFTFFSNNLSGYHHTRFFISTLFLDICDIGQDFFKTYLHQPVPMTTLDFSSHTKQAHVILCTFTLFIYLNTLPFFLYDSEAIYIFFFFHPNLIIKFKFKF